MHQVGLVEGIAVQLALDAVLHQDLRGLAEAGEQLVRGLRGENHRVLAALTVGANGVVIAVEIVEGGMWQPGFVEMQGVDLAVEHFLDVLDVVQHAVVGRLGDGQHTRLGGLVDNERVGVDLLLDVFPGEFALRDRADDAEVVAGRHQENRDGAGHDDRVEHRLVAVAVDDDDVARRHGGVPDDLVRGRGAVGDEIEVVAVEDARCVALGGGNRAGVVEQLAEFLDGIADVGTQHVLAKELVEHLADRALQEGDAAGMARAVPGIRTVGGIVRQGAEEGRRQRIEIGIGLALDVAGNELRRVLVHVNETVQLAQHIVRDMARCPRLAMQENGDFAVAVTNFRYEGTQFRQRLLGLQRQLLVID